jgi:superfamily II DNA/RNA helicase
MSNSVKNQKAILRKLGIQQLNPMQEEAKLAIHSGPEVVLLSPTGTGKTLAFLLPVIAELDRELDEIQALIIVPSRELAIQIEQVAREMGTGYKTNAVYGGRAGSKDKIELRHKPALLIGTPGRVADHIRRENISTEFITALVLDEFDKSLEVGFESEMREIVEALPNLKKKILTSATQEVEIPKFIALAYPKLINYLGKLDSELKYQIIISPSKDKLDSLVRLLKYLGPQPGIIFCNFKDAIARVSQYLHDEKIPHDCFHGGLEQLDRERALIKFRNGTTNLIVATDLAARGLDIPEIKFIIHYHIPNRQHEFVHRNGRTARMHQGGMAYVMVPEQSDVPDFIQELNADQVHSDQLSPHSGGQAAKWQTLFISGGRRDKISKGDIAGLFFKQGQLTKDDLGVIELKQDCAFVAVKANKINQLIQFVDNAKLKTKKVRVKVV